MKQLVFPSELKDGMYQPPFTRPYENGRYDIWYYKGHLHTIAFEEGDNIYLRRTTGDMGALRYKGMFLLNFFCLVILVGMACIGTFQARVANHDTPDHAFTVSLVVSLLLFLPPAYAIIRHCLYPDRKEWRAFHNRDV
jgi:hypothetical protein